MRGFRILKLLVYIQILLLIMVLVDGEKKSHNFEEKYLVFHGGRYWWISDNGKIVKTASPIDASKNVVIGCLNFDGLYIAKDQLNVIKGINGLLKNPDISSLCLEEKYVIFRKGVVVYFHKWEDIDKNADEISERLEYMVPRSVLELLDSGDLLVLKGGWRCPNMKCTHP
jgi:hypothetical protein